MTVKILSYEASSRLNSLHTYRIVVGQHLPKLISLHHFAENSCLYVGSQPLSYSWTHRGHWGNMFGFVTVCRGYVGFDILWISVF